MTNRFYKNWCGFCLGSSLWRVWLVEDGQGLIQTPMSVFVYLMLISCYLCIIAESVRRSKARCIKFYRSVVDFYRSVVDYIQYFKSLWTWFYSIWTWFYSNFISYHVLQPYAIYFWYLLWFTFHACFISCFSDLGAIIDSVMNPPLGYNRYGAPLFPLAFGVNKIMRICFWTLNYKYAFEYFCNTVILLYRFCRYGFDVKHIRDLNGGIYLRRCNDEFYFFSWSNVLIATFWLIVYAATGVDLMQTKWTLLFIMAYICLVDEVVREMYWRKNR
jgi:hypothetical protein